jgi:hypothetical protein
MRLFRSSMVTNRGPGNVPSGFQSAESSFNATRRPVQTGRRAMICNRDRHLGAEFDATVTELLL